MKGKSFLVTGATGLVGNALANLLAYASHKYNLELRIILPARNPEKIRNIYDHDFFVSRWDINEPLCVPGSVDYFVHCACVTRSRQISDQPVDTLNVCYMGTKNVLDLAIEKRAQSVVYLSSMEVYGTGCDGLADEECLGTIPLLTARASYPEGKRAAEALCHAYYTQYRIPVKIARLAQTFGAGVSRDETRVFAQFANSVLKNEDIVLHTDGRSEGNYVALLDALTGILTILMRGISGEAYNVANEEAHTTILSMAEMVAQRIAGGQIKIRMDLTEDPKKFGYAPVTRLFLSSRKLRTLGWSPTASLEEMYCGMIGDWKEAEKNGGI